MAATVAVVYPHMNSIGGDGFWLISEEGRTPIAVGAAALATPEYYRNKGLTKIPERGPLAANTVAGTLSGWDEVLRLSAKLGGVFRSRGSLKMQCGQARTALPLPQANRN